MDGQKDVYAHAEGNWKLSSEENPILRRREISFTATSDNAIVTAFVLASSIDEFWVYPAFNENKLQIVKPFMSSINITNDFDRCHKDKLGLSVLEFIIQHGEFDNQEYAKLMQSIIKNPYDDH